MNPIEIIKKYYKEDSELYRVLLTHSQKVADKALFIAGLHPEMNLDKEFIYQAAMLHDIGIYLCDAPDIYCTGKEPYIRHGVLGAEILRREGFERHALVCERLTGAGIPLKQILDEDMPLPHRDMLPVTMEEKIICLADKFFSKSGSGDEKKLEKIRKSISRFGADSLERFDQLCALFL